jgi:hypothetical protein
MHPILYRPFFALCFSLFSLYIAEKNVPFSLLCVRSMLVLKQGDGDGPKISKQTYFLGGGGGVNLLLLRAASALGGEAGLAALRRSRAHAPATRPCRGLGSA